MSDRARIVLRRTLPWTEHMDEARWAVLVALVDMHGSAWLHEHGPFVEAVYAGAWDRAAALLAEEPALAAQMRTGAWS